MEVKGSHPRFVISRRTQMTIGTLAEKSLHAALKRWYDRSGDQFEVDVDGFIIDIVRGDLLIEIQTRHLYAMKHKLNKLLPDHTLLLLHPIPQEKWIVRQTAAGEPISRRKSPKRGRPIDIFSELVRIPHLLTHPNLTLEILLTQQEEILRDDGKGSWRRKGWSLYDHRLLHVVDHLQLATTADFRALLPSALPQPFTNRQLADALNCRLNLAQKITYTLRKIGEVTVTGKQGNALLHQL